MFWSKQNNFIFKNQRDSVTLFFIIAGMQMITIEQKMEKLFEEWAGEKAVSCALLPESGSNRNYYRVKGESKTAISVHSEDRKENLAFLNFSQHFLKHNLNVPQIYGEDLNNNIYLQQDLGDETLFSLLTKKRNSDSFPQEIKSYYKEIISVLPLFQVKAGKDLDYSFCYPRNSFDRQSMMWDLNYFKYYFLKLAKIPFDEQNLEDDFKTFTDYLLSCPRDYFLYRDFQSRNIMISNNDIFFIDYQGGRKGALQYDLASFLYDAKADIPDDFRKELYSLYLDNLEKWLPIDRQQFQQYYNAYIFIRIMQALGAYGFRGFYERKEHFLQSVPYAIQNLEQMLTTANLPVEIPALTEAWSRLIGSSSLRSFSKKHKTLAIRINSFSFKKGIPWDEKGHGGGFVFDCRSLPNPGRYEKFKSLNGYDKPVIDFLNKETAVDQFLKHIYAIISSAVTNYQNRNFTDLLISFGCTGGQHRSVFCANQLAHHIKSLFEVDIILHHIEQDKKETF